MSNVAEIVEAEKPTSRDADVATMAEPEFEDVDDKELAEAEAALTVETETGDQPDPAGDKPEAVAPVEKPVAKAEAAKVAAPDPASDEAAASPNMVPIGRLNEALSKADKERTAAIYWEGVAQGALNSQKGTDGAAGATADAVVKPPQDRIVDVRAAKVALAEQFDNGEITAAQWESQRSALEDQEDAIRQEVLAAASTDKAAPQANNGSREGELYVQDLTDQIAEEHPYVALIGEPEDSRVAAQRWQNLEREAATEMMEKGFQFHPGTDGKLPARELLALRAEVANLTDRYGPLWFPNATLPASTDPQPTTSQPGGKPAGQGENLSERQLARKTKLALAAAQPPDSTDVGGTGGTREYSDADILAMSEEELDALPESLRRKFDPEYSTG